MSAVLAGTWSIISSSAEVITGVGRMTLRIHRMLQPGSLELREVDRRRLLGLQKRVECLVQPLNYLLLWSKRKDSCVQQTVLDAQELLFDACAFVERFVPPPTRQPREGSVDDGMVPSPRSADALAPAFDSEELEYFLRELEFACTSVTMAMGIVQAHEALPVPDADLSVSPAALLRASRRIQDMCGRSGDLCACPGRLYVSSPSRLGPVSEFLSECEGQGITLREEAWSAALSLATMKVVAAPDATGARRYSLRVESRLPLSKRDHQASDELGFGSDEPSRTGLNTSGPMAFPIEVAFGARLVTTGQMDLPAEPENCYGDLGIDAPALLWAAVQLDPGDAVSLEFPDAVLLPDAAADRALRIRRQRKLLGNQAQGGRYAFVFDGPKSMGGSSEWGLASPSGEAALSPPDSLYLARLCAFDDQQCPASDRRAQEAAVPPHLLLADEVLLALLQGDD